MISFKTVLPLLVLAMPGAAMAATDGTPGPTSTGSFGATLTVNGPSGAQVQIYGLDDFDFGSISTAGTTQTFVQARIGHYCVSRSDPGEVRLSFAQAGVPNGSPFQLRGAGGPTDFIETNVRVENFQFSYGIQVYAGSIATIPRSDPGCTASSTGNGDNRMVVQPLPLPALNSRPLSGSYSGTITITAAAL